METLNPSLQLDDTSSRSASVAGGQVTAPASNEDRTAQTERQPARSAKSAESKSELVLKKLRFPKGVTLAALGDQTGWKPHSVRGFLSGTVRKKLNLNLVSEVGKDGVRRYRIDAVSKPA